MTRSNRLGSVRILLLAAASLLALVGTGAAQEAPATPPADTTPAPTPQAAPAGPGQPRPYDRVITKDAKSDTGVAQGAANRGVDGSEIARDVDDSFGHGGGSLGGD